MSDDIVARAKAALEDSYHVLHGSELVAELADEVERLRTELDEAWAVIGMDRVTLALLAEPREGADDE